MMEEYEGEEEEEAPNWAALGAHQMDISPTWPLGPPLGELVVVVVVLNKNSKLLNFCRQIVGKSLDGFELGAGHNVSESG